MSDEYAQRFRREAEVEAYETEVFAHGTFDRHIGDLEISWLIQELGRLGLHRFTHHDFATGTGRILEALAPHATASIGYDQSPVMLRQAASRVPTATLKLTSAADYAPLPTRGPVVVTSFRLILNAPERTRKELLGFARAALENRAGVLVINNHGHTPSLRSLARLRSQRRRGSQFNELQNSVVRRLLRRYGFSIVAQGGFGLVPRSTYESRIAAVNLAAHRLNRQWAGRMPGVSSHVVYVARLGHP